MRTLDWFERDFWLQRLQSCYPVHAKQTVKIYPFPMDEVLFQILKRAKLEEPWDLRSQLQRFREHYHRAHPEFTATIEELTASGWLDNFCGRWSLVGTVRQEHIDSVEDGDLREILCFLSWLQENIPEEQSAVYLEDWDGTLAELRGRYPEVPDTDWFIQQQILCEDRKHLCRLPYTLDRHHVHLALARLLLDCRTAEEQAQWAEIAHQLKATEKLMNYIPWDRQSEVVALMADRVLSGTLPGAGEESRRIWRQEMLERRRISSEIVEADILSEDDSMQNLTRAEREYWERFPWFWHRNVWRSFELSIVTRHIRNVPLDKLDAVLARLERLHSLGMLELHELPPEACLELLRYPQTQFLSMWFLTKLHREQSDKGGNGAGDCVLAWISFALRQTYPLEGAPIARLLLYLAEYAFPGTRRNRPDTRLLQAVLRELSMFCCSKTDLLTAVTEQVIQAMDTSTGVTLCRRFQLLCSWADQLHQNMPEDQRADSPLLELLYDSLEQGLDMLLNKPFCKEAAYVPSSVFEQSYWPELYERMGQKDRKRMRECVMCWYCGKPHSHHEQFDARYQFRLGLGWLTALVQSLEDDKQVIQAFGSLLFYVLEEKNQLLTIEYHDSAAEHGELERAIHMLRRDRADMAQLLDRLRTLCVAELVLLVQYSGDEATHAFFLEALEERA